MSEVSMLVRIRTARAESQAGLMSAQDWEQLSADIEAHLQVEQAAAEAAAKAAEEAQEARIRQAISTLSFTEEAAMAHIAREMPDEGEVLLVASKIADAHGFTRSVIVNALRKLESAGIIESRSLGMKGTMIKPLVPGLRERLLKIA